MAEEDDEITALKDGVDVDSEKIAEQILNKSGGGKPPEKKPDEKKPDEKKPDEKKPDEHKPEVPTPEAIRAAVLNEMFGEQFKTVEDVKKANIPEALKERELLRQKNQELSDSLAKKPKHAFASDDIAKFNEFARETGIKDAVVFNKLNYAEVANMDDMDALILQRVIESTEEGTSLAGKEPQVRRSFEKKFNVDPKKVELQEMTQEELDENLFEMRLEAGKAKKKLAELKSKIKMPEIPAEETPQSKKWTPEVEAVQKANWQKVSEKMGESFKTIPILMDGAKEPIVNFVLPEDAIKVINKNAYDYAINNQVEVNETNVRSIAMQMYSDAVLPNLDKIAKIIFDRARSMTEEEALKAYSNPTEKNTDTPDLKNQPLSDEEKAERAYQAEMKG
jgi:uncharacterized coiled-coil protein SlyX